MKITFHIHDHQAEEFARILKSMLAQIEPSPELLLLKVNGLYWTAANQMAHCVDIRGDHFICEIKGVEYPFFSDGEPVRVPGYPVYYHQIIEKIRH